MNNKQLARQLFHISRCCFSLFCVFSSNIKLKFLFHFQEAYWLEQYSWALFKAMSHMLCIGYGRCGRNKIFVLSTLSFSPYFDASFRELGICLFVLWVSGTVWGFYEATLGRMPRVPNNSKLCRCLNYSNHHQIST